MATNKHTSGFGIAKQELHGEPDIHDRNKASDNPSDEADAVKKPSELDVALTRKWEAEAHFIKTAKTKKELAEAELSDWKSLEADSQIGKLAAETTFINEPQTQKAYAEAALAEVRRLEAIAEIKRLDVEKERLAVDRLRLMAETKFTEGPRTFREKQSGNDARSQAVKNYGSIFAGVFQAGIILFALYVVMQFI